MFRVRSSLAQDFEQTLFCPQHLAAGLNVREAAARVKIGKTALYEALKAEKATTSTVKPT